MALQASLNDKTSQHGTVYDEMIDLIAQGGGPTAVIAFRPSDDVQDRAYELINRKRDGIITDEESNQLSHYVELEHILRMAKTRARLVLQNEASALPAHE